MSDPSPDIVPDRLTSEENVKAILLIREKINAFEKECRKERPQIPFSFSVNGYGIHYRRFKGEFQFVLFGDTSANIKSHICDNLGINQLLDFLDQLPRIQRLFTQARNDHAARVRAFLAANPSPNPPADTGGPLEGTQT
jgi:hypothetical protein